MVVARWLKNHSIAEGWGKAMSTRETYAPSSEKRRKELEESVNMGRLYRWRKKWDTGGAIQAEIERGHKPNCALLRRQAD
jgi:hypothetical protein